MRKAIAGIALGASVLAGGAASATIFAPGLAVAQDAGDDSTTDETTADEARPERQTLADVLAPLVDDGTITQPQADAVIGAIQEARPEGRRGHKGPGGFGAKDVVIDALGITAEELRAALVDGSTIADVAVANGVDVQTVIDAIVAAGQERIDAAVEAGNLTEDEAAEKAAALEEKATAMVNGEADFGRRGGRRGHGNHGNGPGVGTDTADESTDA